VELMRLRLPAVLLLLTVPFVTLGAEQSFSDVPPSREEHRAVENLKNRGVVQGRPDGTFGPDDAVNRAEAITIVVRAVANVKNLPQLRDCFPDVHGDHWYVQAVCYAKDLDWVEGYPDGSFQPVRTVAKAEFLKILFNAYGTDTDATAELHIPLAPDAANPDEWYYPFLTFALANSMTRVDSFGNLNPGAALTRGQVALLLHRYLLYREGGRDQDILSNAEKDIRAVFEYLDELRIDRASFAAGRVAVASWGASQRVPETRVVKVTTKLSEALRTLVEAYRLVQGGNLPEALVKASAAYHLADEADALNQGVTVYTDRVRSYAHDLAEDIRSHGEG
jgi:hypothetical protein